MASSVAPAAASEEGLSVIALVSGGKDSFFSILHCLANGHRVVALANLHPAGRTCSPRATTHREETSVAGARAAAGEEAPVDEGTAVTVLLPGEAQGHGHGHGHGHGPGRAGGSPAGTGSGTVQDSTAATETEEKEEEDLNSFMYQTVGHQVIPLYAEATGIPLYRKAIEGDAGQHGKDYSPGGSSSEDETESMIPLLEAIKAAHPEANAICAGAILSTYQRTRVESVATRLGLVPLAYLWKFPTLPVPIQPGSLGGGSAAGSDAQLLDDMAAVGLEARIIKVASGGLDESFLWTNVASADGKEKVARAMSRFGTAEKGAVIGEGGEFETLVLDGPPELFKKHIVVDEKGRRVINEGGGTAWLSLRGARVQDKEEGSLGHDAAKNTHRTVRIPDLLHDRFVNVLDGLSTFNDTDKPAAEHVQVDQQQFGEHDLPNLGNQQEPKDEKLQQWFFMSGSPSSSIKEQTTSIVTQIRQRLQQHKLTPTAIINSTIVLRQMADFPSINAIYGSLFNAPNPPSRVTISCGDSLLPRDAKISIALAVHTNLKQDPSQRQGLHVQSRSYWAPANIGPYSQAISFPLASLGSSSTTDSGDGLRLVSIAGQIPLVPATMALPPASSDSLGCQLVLSLQHLWRIGADVDVRWWSSAVVYFPRQQEESAKSEDDNDDVESGALAMALGEKAQLAGRAWEAAHMWSEKKKRDRGDDEGDGDSEEEEDEAGPDLWDRRFNTRYMSFAAAGDGEKAKGQKLPDWTVLDEDGSNEKRRAMVPPLFVAEVEELPRGAGVEWHAHMGIAGGDQDDVLVLKGERRKNLSVYQTIVGSSGVRMVQTIVAEEVSKDQEEQDQFAREAIARLGTRGTSSGNDWTDERPTIVVRYVDAGVYRGAQAEMISSSVPVVPCRSLWNGTVKGERLASVTVYQSIFER
ncbi:hypothetical protein QBC37DRAFT_305026 [Rhypophila decipiens]|uniref:Diphthine--ammonia ligase n=1 Tax=Rhypophila decipiens TaxID=261697 RepID=A0AAN6YGK8_9PEZI|nr:hypothetical protein QBC37DRAFT_305026 [Rhypophila decipiens]